MIITFILLEISRSGLRKVDYVENYLFVWFLLSKFVPNKLSSHNFSQDFILTFVCIAELIYLLIIWE